jgi:hypothetical protein
MLEYNRTPWVPDSPSHPARSTGDDAFPMTRYGGNPRRTATEPTVWEECGLYGGTLALAAAILVTIALLIFVPPDVDNQRLAQLFSIPCVLFVIGWVCCTVGRHAEDKRLTRESTALAQGNNPCIRIIWRRVADHTVDLDDILWDIYEDLTELADEAARRRDHAGPAELGAYNDGIAELAGKIRRICEQRDTAEAAKEAEAATEEEFRREALDELTAGDANRDDENAELLQKRLTDKAQMWDRIVPDDAPRG